MLGSQFDIYFSNLLGLEPEDSRFYRTKPEALDGLKKLSGQDFGYNPVAWLRWGVENHWTVVFGDYLEPLIEWEKHKKINPENTENGI